MDTTTKADLYLIYLLRFSLRREVIRERTRSRLEAAIARERKGGQTRGLIKEAKKTAMLAQTLYYDSEVLITKPLAKTNTAKCVIIKSFYLILGIFKKT